MRNERFRYATNRYTRQAQKREDFEKLEATELYCPKCKQAVPVSKYLLLILPDGDRYEYRCRFCGTKVGNQINRSGQYYAAL